MCVHNFFYITGLHLVENGTTDQKDSSTVYRMLPLPLTKTICIKSNQEKMITAVIIF